MYDALRDDLAGRLAEARDGGTYKTELVMTTPQGAHVEVEAARTGQPLREQLSRPRRATRRSSRPRTRRSTAGVTGWRPCASSAARRPPQQLEERHLRSSSGPTTRSSSARASTPTAGCSRPFSTNEDAIISDELNHASIIDGIRLCKAAAAPLRERRHGRARSELVRAAEAHATGSIATDGVFSMDGYLARLDRICDLAERYDALVMVDDSHAVGFVGPTGRGTPELHGVMERVDIFTGTLGKALGGASGGYVSGRREIVELLRQRSRPYLFSNTWRRPSSARACARSS